jgi:hypothetical protein
MALGLVAQIRFGLGPGSDNSNQALYRAFQAFLGHSFFAKKKVTCKCVRLMLVILLEPGNRSHYLDFLRHFSSCLLPEIV